MSASFKLFLATRGLSSLAFQGASVAIGWLVYDRTNDPLSLGLIGLVQFLPMLVLTFVAGHVADQFDRRRIVLCCLLVEAATIGMVALALWQGWLPTWAIFAAVALIGAAQAFERPTMSALLPAIVPIDAVPRAVTNFTSVTQVAMIVGPAAGGLLYGLGPSVPFLAATMSFLAAAVAIFMVKTPRRTGARAPITLGSVLAGLHFIRTNPTLFGTISLDMCAVLLGGAMALMPVYARDILVAGPWALGLLRMSPALGALSMSFYLARFPLTRRVGPLFLFSIGIFGMATLVFAFSRSIELSILMLAVLGAADTVSVIIRSSLVQIHTPDEMRGRVNAVNSLFIGTSNQLGDFEAGALAALIGPVAAVAVGGVGTMGMVAVWSGLFPKLRRLDTLHG